MSVWTLPGALKEDRKKIDVESSTFLTTFAYLDTLFFLILQSAVSASKHFNFSSYVALCR